MGHDPTRVHLWRTLREQPSQRQHQHSKTLWGLPGPLPEIWRRSPRTALLGLESIGSPQQTGNVTRSFYADVLRWNQTGRASQNIRVNQLLRLGWIQNMCPQRVARCKLRSKMNHLVWRNSQLEGWGPGNLPESKFIWGKWWVSSAQKQKPLTKPFAIGPTASLLRWARIG